MENESYIGQMQDTLLGQEFLTWLWYAGESQAHQFKDTEGRDFDLHVTQRVQVQGGEGDNLETATVTGALSDLKEARLGLTTGKKVHRALIVVEMDGETWQATLKAEDFSINSLKTPVVEREDDDDPDAVFLEKMYLIERFLACLDAVYAEFIELRSSSQWEKELGRFRDWLKET
ncbi:MAG: hypothetical protein D6E12_04075 [Desulfovibrio sp.]|nr:MAG: hypothetical protein D6E12_04075 [Desulfovibrio sp.]